MKVILSNIFWKYVIPFINFIYYILNKSNIILINGWTINICTKVYHRNFGDDIAYDIVRFLVKNPKVKVMNLNCIMFADSIKEKNYIIIGSVIDMGFCNSNTIVYGGGIMKQTNILKQIPFKVISVRGPLTRNYLKGYGVDCPSLYGDSAFILSKMYTPRKIKKYKVGLIPHTWEESFPIVKELNEKIEDSVIISLKNYVSWQSVVDKISECELILSSSLHGIIVSDVYSIPNKRVKFDVGESKKDLKFMDYFFSVQRRDMENLDLTKEENQNINIQKIIDNYEKLNIDVGKLLSQNPFKQYS